MPGGGANCGVGASSCCVGTSPAFGSAALALPAAELPSTKPANAANRKFRAITACSKMSVPCDSRTIESHSNSFVSNRHDHEYSLGGLRLASFLLSGNATFTFQDARPMTPNSNINWHPDEDVTPTPKDVETMACVLEGRHGQFAAEVAEFFASLHGQNNDAGRTWAWAGVAEVVRHRERLRLQG